MPLGPEPCVLDKLGGRLYSAFTPWTARREGPTWHPRVTLLGRGWQRGRCLRMVLQAGVLGPQPEATLPLDIPHVHPVSIKP